MTTASAMYPLSRKLVSLFAAAENPQRRQVLYHLLKHVERRADLLGLKTGFLNRARRGQQLRGRPRSTRPPLRQLAPARRGVARAPTIARSQRPVH